jgi:excisionase family DNA binding protein
MEKTLLRVGEAANFLAVSRWTIYRWVEEGRLEGTKIGRGSLRIFASSIERLVDKNRTEDLHMASPSDRRLLPTHGSSSRRVETY